MTVCRETEQRLHAGLSARMGGAGPGVLPTNRLAEHLVLGSLAMRAGLLCRSLR